MQERSIPAWTGACVALLVINVVAFINQILETDLLRFVVESLLAETGSFDRGLRRGEAHPKALLEVHENEGLLRIQGTCSNFSLTSTQVLVTDGLAWFPEEDTFGRVRGLRRGEYHKI